MVGQVVNSCLRSSHFRGETIAEPLQRTCTECWYLAVDAEDHIAFQREQEREQGSLFL